MSNIPSVPAAPFPWQQPCWSIIQQQLEQDRLPHGILLQGMAESGVEGFALLMAQYLLCDSPRSGLPCDQCRSCHFYKAGSHPDFEYLTLEPTEKGDKLSRVIKIEQIRNTLDTILQTAMHSSRKVLVIAPADALHPAAANALLKNLEEPPPGTIFLLASNNPARLMATIRSRCQALAIPLPSATQALEWLKPWIADSNKASQLLAMAGQNPLLVKRWVEEGAVDQVLAISSDLEQLEQGRFSALQLASHWQKSGVYNRLLWWWRWLSLQARQGGQDQAMTAKHLSFMNKLLVAKRQLEGTANPSELLMLESLLIDWHNLRP